MHSRKTVGEEVAYAKEVSRCAFAVLKDETVCLCAEGHEVIDDGEDIHLSDVLDHIQPEDVIVGGSIYSDVGDGGDVGSIGSNVCR